MQGGKGKPQMMLPVFTDWTPKMPIRWLYAKSAFGLPKVRTGGPTPTHLLEMGWRGPSPLFSGGMTSFGRGHPHVVRRVGGDLARSADASVIVVDPRCHRDLLASLLA